MRKYESRHQRESVVARFVRKIMGRVGPAEFSEPEHEHETEDEVR